MTTRRRCSGHKERNALDYNCRSIAQLTRTLLLPNSVCCGERVHYTSQYTQYIQSYDTNRSSAQNEHRHSPISGYFVRKSEYPWLMRLIMILLWELALDLQCFFDFCAGLPPVTGVRILQDERHQSWCQQRLPLTQRRDGVRSPRPGP